MYNYYNCQGQSHNISAKKKLLVQSGPRSSGLAAFLLGSRILEQTRKGQLIYTASF